MGQKIEIVVSSSQHYGGQQEEITTESSGQLYIKGDSYYLKYKAELAAGEEVETTLKIKENSLKLIRRGELQTCQEFIPEQRTSFDYRTPYGNLKLWVEVEQLSLDLEPTGGQIRLEYLLFDEADELVSKNSLTVDYKLESSKEG